MNVIEEIDIEKTDLIQLVRSFKEISPVVVELRKAISKKDNPEKKRLLKIIQDGCRKLMGIIGESERLDIQVAIANKQLKVININELDTGTLHNELELFRRLITDIEHSKDTRSDRVLRMWARIIKLMNRIIGEIRTWDDVESDLKGLLK